MNCDIILFEIFIGVPQDKIMFIYNQRYSLLYIKFIDIEHNLYISIIIMILLSNNMGHT